MPDSSDSNLGDLLREKLEQRSSDVIFRCPDCGTFLDAPRVNPGNDRLARKCPSCREWHPLEAAGFDGGPIGP